MKEKINIAEILRDKPVNTKLYSPLFSEVFFSHVSRGGIAVEHNGGTSLFFSNGKFYDYDGAEPLLFPSKEMRDWSKFAWKKGDVLVSEDNVHIIFEKFEDDTYTRFKGKHYLWKECDEEDYNKEETKMLTSVFEKATDDVAQTYIKTIEEHLYGKLNLETLEIEKQLEFKDGDIITFKDRIIIIYNTSIEKSPKRTEIYYHACLKEGELTVNEYLMSCGFGEGWYSSTEEEKQQLFDALEKEGKAWDAEKKQIVDIKKELQFKPFEKVLVRDSIDDVWRASFFSHIKEDDERYVTTGLSWKFCIPYEGNEHLLGTTDNFE